MHNLKPLGWTLLSVVLLAACVSQKPNTQSPSLGDARISNQLDTSAVLKSSFTGLMLYDLAEHKVLYSRNADRYFTPASNTKLYTLYACLSTLPDSVPALRYQLKNDSLIFWGTGDPTFLHPQFSPSRTLDFLRQHANKKIIFSDGNFTNEPLGKGWMWDDYNDDYQPELSPLPMYGNVVQFRVKNSNVTVEPAIFESTFFAGNNPTQVVRAIAENRFYVSQSILDKTDFKQDIPFKTSAVLTRQLLIDTLKQNVTVASLPLAATAQTLYSLPVDTVYRRMMYISDNLLAEHLLLLCGSQLTGEINSLKTIDLLTKKHFGFLPDPPKWVDGSGLSRYNLFTPRSTVALLEKMHGLIPQERLFSLLASGDKVGTLRNLYPASEPFIFAKSGTVSGVYNLSGYLRTQSGKLLLFSFMNNNFNGSATPVRKEVERILTWIHVNY